MRTLLIVLLLPLGACSVLQHDKSRDPKTCRERAAYDVKNVYTDPAALAQALDTICEGQEIPTTTRDP